VLSVSDAARAVLERMPRMSIERVPIDDARGRVLADDVVASRALPGFDNSAMDGYAARSGELGDAARGGVDRGGSARSRAARAEIRGSHPQCAGAAGRGHRRDAGRRDGRRRSRRAPASPRATISAAPAKTSRSAISPSVSARDSVRPSSAYSRHSAWRRYRSCVRRASR
jgi:hypothetical protein